MTAIDSYELFVGEIGMLRREYLYDVSFWEMRRILRGYRKRYRDMWSATRWQAFYIMSSMSDLKKAGIYNPTDLIKFPWEKEVTKLTDDEMDDLEAALQEERERLNRKQP
jgi:hypothetical protein